MAASRLSVARKVRQMRAAELATTIRDLRASGATSLRAIAEGLNARGIRTARGAGRWSAVQVQRVLSRIEERT
jgi:Recombinase